LGTASHWLPGVIVTCPWICTPLIASRMVWFNCITAFRTPPR